MLNTGTLKVTTPTDREIVLTRIFDAPRTMVYDALTKPELLKRWFGPRGFSLSHCEVDLRVGGKWRFILRMPDGREMGMGGEYRELERPGHIIHTEAFDDFPGEAIATTALTEDNGKTTMILTVLSPSKEIRDMHIANGMEHGAAESYDKLAEVLQSLAA